MLYTAEEFLPAGSKEILCKDVQIAHGKFFFYIRDEKAQQIQQEKVIVELNKVEKWKKSRVWCQKYFLRCKRDEEEPVI